MGGTFDPIHLGHLTAAATVADRLRLDTVIFVPAGEPWHRGRQPVAGREQRFEMTCRAVAGDPRFVASRADIDRPGPTFTIDTLTDLKQARKESGGQATGDDAWFFITGADALAGFMSWRQPLGILGLAHLVGVTRPGHALIAPALPPGTCTLIETPGIDVSSTEVRDRIRDGLDSTGLVPASVADYIADHGLYARQPS
jgi:nicotinate-nucleotide adenylyltransferase